MIYLMLSYVVSKVVGRAMTQKDKKLQKMRQNPRDWKIEDLQSIADEHELQWLHDGGSHVVFRSHVCEHLSVPAHRPIKPFYIKRFLLLLDQTLEVRKRKEDRQ